MVLLYGARTTPSTQKIFDNTYAETLALFKSGLNAEQIATQRNLKASTIYSHFEVLYRDNQIENLASFINISDDEIQSIRQILPELNADIKLKEIFDRLDGKLEYHKIKLILAHLQK